jgi:hypothetical protein
MFLRIYFKKYVALFICFSNLIYMYFHQGFKNSDIQKMIYNHFLLNLLKIGIFFLLLFGGPIVKMNHFNLFEEVLKFLFYT